MELNKCTRCGCFYVSSNDVCPTCEQKDVAEIDKLKNLTPGTAITFGTAFKIPLISKLDLPNPMPESTSVDIASRWF